MRTDNEEQPPQAKPKGDTSSAQASVMAWIENLTLLHVGLLVVATTWTFGGQSEGARVSLSLLASGGAVITLTGLTREWFWSTRRARFWPCLLSFVAFGSLVLAGSASPSLREAGGGMLRLVEVSPWLPSSARPKLAHQSLWYFAAVWISALNVLLFIHRGRLLRILFLLIAGNALVLAVLGTLQKLSGSTGIFFGNVPVPQPRFFSTFVYHNHWGAFTVMMLALVLGLGWHYVRTVRSRDIHQGPLAVVVFAMIAMVITLPLSASRSCTIIGAAFIAGASVHAAVHAAQRRRSRGLSTLPPYILLASLWLGLVGAAWLTGRTTILDRIETSSSQIAAMREMGGVGDRALLYHNTWRMAQDKPLFGWGMSSYPHIFYGFYNTRKSVDQLPVFYNDAHNDWLQSLAEYGFVGTELLVACAAIPLWLCRRDIRRSLITKYILSGLGVVVVYALVEFPFGNRANVLVWWVLFFAALAYAKSREPHPGEAPEVSPKHDTSPCS